MRFPGSRQHRQFVFTAIENGFDDAVHQQIRVAANRASEMRVGVVCQAKMPAVSGRVDGLRHGTQKHGMNLQGIRSVFGGLCNGLKLARFGVVADAVANTGHF